MGKLRIHGLMWMHTVVYSCRLVSNIHSIGRFSVKCYIDFLFCAPWVSLLRQVCARYKFIIINYYSDYFLQYYGMTEMNYYTVLFGVSRALGTLSSLVWDRALGLPLERPKSMSTEGLMKLTGAK